MNFKTLYGRLRDALRPAWIAAATHVLLCVSAAHSAFRERVRSIASHSYGAYLAVVIGLLLPTFLVWVLPVGLFVHLRRFVREVIDDFRAIDLSDFTREGWKRNTGQ